MEYGKSEMLKRRRTKIVATVGPTSDDRETIGRLIDTGVDVFRMNMSHGDHDGHRAAYGHIRVALEIGVDLLALSFVRSAADIKELRAMLSDDQAPGIIAKIERPEALDAMDEIIAAADGVMVARGDLGVELPAELVPVAQRDLIVRARAQGKPSIVATQMLESMIEHPQPTRAEVSDVSTAVFSGADAVMLSAETASGLYPVRAVEMMDRIARRIESQEWTEGRFRTETAGFPAMPLHDASDRAVAQLSRDLRI